MPDAPLGAGDTALNKTDTDSCPLRVYSLVESMNGGFRDRHALRKEVFAGEYRHQKDWLAK